MQIGFDVGATKIESVILKDNGEEVDRSRRDCPKDYISIVQTIKDVVVELEKKHNKTKENFPASLSFWTKWLLYYAFE